MICIVVICGWFPISFTDWNFSGVLRVQASCELRAKIVNCHNHLERIYPTWHESVYDLPWTGGVLAMILNQPSIKKELKQPHGALLHH